MKRKSNFVLFKNDLKKIKGTQKIKIELKKTIKSNQYHKLLEFNFSNDYVSNQLQQAIKFVVIL